MDLHETAMAWANAGFCVVRQRADESKGPIGKWEQFIATARSPRPAPPSPQIVDAWYGGGGQTGVGLITGTVSGGAEMFEFEGRAIQEGLIVDFTRLCEENGAAEIWERLRLGYTEKTRGGGLHFIFRVSDGPALPCTKLAQRPSTEVEIAERLAVNPNDRPEFMIETLLETRGEGGHVIVAPTVKPNGTWKFMSGVPGEVAILTCAERDQFYDIARMLNQIEIKPPVVRAPREKVEGALTPFDAYRAEMDWHDILPDFGWSHVVDKNGSQQCGQQRCYWVRPGKNQGDDGWTHSASTGNTDGVSDSLWVWSTTAGLPVKEGLSKEYVYAHYNHSGDLSEAARSLREQGYGGGGEAVSRVVAGDTNPFSDGFDPMAWAKEKAAAKAAASAAGPVPTVGPTASDSRADQGGGEVSGVGDTETPADHAEGEFQALDLVVMFEEDYVQEWIVEGLLPRESTVALYSASGLGKSIFMLEMAANIAIGAPFLGLKTNKTRVLYIDHENGPRATIVPRLKSMGFKAADLDDLKILSFPEMAALDTEAGKQSIGRAVAQFDPGLVIIDTVSRTIQGEENSNDTWLAFFNNTGRFLKTAQIAYVRLDHSGKDEAKGQRGGSAKTGDVEIILQLTGNGKRFTLKQEKDRDEVLPVAGYVFDRLRQPTRSVRKEARTPDGKFPAAVQAKIDKTRLITDALKVPGTGGLAKSRIRDVVGGQQQGVNDILDALVEKRFVTCDAGTGKYSWNAERASEFDPKNPFSDPVA